MFEGIDISIHNTSQAPIDWKQVQKAGKTFVMIRAGWADDQGKIREDATLADSVEKAYQAGLKVGLYLYDYCSSLEAHRIAARNLIAIANRFSGKLEMPLALDVEETSLPVLTSQGREGLTAGVIAFLNEIQKAGYYAVWYSYTSFIKQHLNQEKLKAYDLWLADYRLTPWNTIYGILQYSGDGTCPGVKGPCDLNHTTKNYPEILRKAGLNHLNELDYKALYEKIKSQLEELQKKYNELLKKK